MSMNMLHSLSSEYTCRYSLLLILSKSFSIQIPCGHNMCAAWNKIFLILSHEGLGEGTSILLACPYPPSPQSATCLLSFGQSSSPKMVCRGRCKQLPQIKGANRNLYDEGFRYCSCCEIYICSEKTRCFCCGRSLRLKIGRQSRPMGIHMKDNND